MPYPLGHTAIGLTTYELNGQKATPAQRLWVFGVIMVLTNLPDLDILAGLIVAGNGQVFHRGPTHSLLFAIIVGFLASRAAGRLKVAPPLGFGMCTALVFSHVIADLLFTHAPVSLFWPFEVHFTQGSSSLGDICHSILFKSLGDMGIFMGCMAVIGAVRWGRSREIWRRIFQFRFLGEK